MVAARLPKLQVVEQSTQQLISLERNFKRLVRERPALSEALLLDASRSSRGLTKFTAQSRQHHKLTRSMLSLIDQYVKLHRRAREGVEVTLPGLMRMELNSLKMHRPLTVGVTTRSLSKAIEGHNKRQMALHQRAESLIGRHGIGLTLGSGSRRRA